MRRSVAAVACLLATSVLVSSTRAHGQATAPQQPAFHLETRADLILIDANVVDNTGAPIGDLTRDDFVVSVDGRPRTITSLQFVKSAAPAESTAPKTLHYSSNEGTSEGRRIMIAVDENSIPPGGARAVLMSIERLLKDLSPADQVAFIRLPHFENSIGFSLDRRRVFDAVKKTTGKARRVGMGPVTIAEAVAFDRRDTGQWERALTRICSAAMPTKSTSAKPAPSGGVGFDSADEVAFCRQEAENDAIDKISTYQRRARETVDGLRQILANLRAVPGPKTLVLLSQGFLSHDRRFDITRLADAAAAARVSLYAMYIDTQGLDLDVVESSFTRLEDERLMAEGIDDLAGASRGARFRVTGSGEGVFARVARELSGYYLIGLEPTADDRDGKPHRIKVDVRRSAATVRARAQFTIDAAAESDASSSATPGAQLLELLRAATPEPGVPLRLAAFAAPAASPGRVKVIVGVDIGAPTASPVELNVGFVLVDADGKVAADQFIAVVLRPDGADQASVPRYIGNAEVPPGEYTVRFAVIDPQGRAGSVHHPVVARLKEAGSVSASDLILTTPARSGPLRPEVHVSLEGEALQALVELMASEPARLNAAQVTFEVAERGDGPSIVSQRGSLRHPDAQIRPAVATLDVGVLPPGDYVARAIVNVPGEKPLTSSRPFQIAPRARVAKRAEAAGAATGAVSRGRTRPPIPPFKPEDVLAPAVVNPFIDHVLTSYSPSRAGRDALTAIRAGNLKHATRGERQASDVGLSFAQGLSMLAENRTAEAHAYFRAALRFSSDFIGAAFYLGATLAASGKDRDAVGAWQTALISEVGAAGVYPVLIDGLLRLGDAEQALEMLKEAEPTFTDRSGYERRLIQVYALMARYADALPRAHEYLSSHSADADMLFLTMHMIYEANALGELSDSAVELERFAVYAAKYAAANGAQMLVVQGWRKALGIR